MTWPFQGLAMFGYHVMVIDPPTKFELYSEAGMAKSAGAQYPVMEWDELEEMPVGQLAAGDCLVLLWACGPTLDKSMGLLRAWGIEYVSEIAWRKVSRNGKPMMGTGYRVRSMHESILLGKVGEPHHKPFPSIFDGVRREHSRKPEEFYRLVDQKVRPEYFKLDLFSRQTREGWTNWGNESTKFDAEAPIESTRRRQKPETQGAENGSEEGRPDLGPLFGGARMDQEAL